MTDIPETPNELAKRLWDTAIQHLEQATNETDVATSDAYVRIGELALSAAQFALANQAFLMGIPSEFGLPPGAPPLPSSIAGMPPGAPPPPMWGKS